MEHFDVLVVGSGSGMTIVEGALNKGLRVAIVEKDQLGGTCLNRGCIPSKMVLYPTDVVQEIKHVASLGVKATIDDVDFQAIMDRMRRSVAEDRHHMEEGVKHAEKLAYYPVSGEFTGDYRMRVGAEEIEATNIFLVSGARPEIPPIKGLDKVSYLTSRDVWDMKQPPESMIIIGGGYIAAEMAHFFSGVGVEVKILSRSPRLLRHEEPEIGETLTQALRTRMVVRTGVEFVEVNETGGIKEVTVKEEKGEKRIYRADSILVAAGQRGNADLLHVEKTGVQADDHGYIKVNEFYETGKPRIWAFGDAIGRAMFKHVANREAELVWHGFDHDHKQALDYDKVPYAIFSWPQVAGVGITEEEAARRGLKYLVGGYAYGDTAYGSAMGEEDGFVKLMVEEETYRILGCHIVGPHAAILIHEVIVAMNAGDGSVYPLVDAMHIHPALSEVVQRAVWHLQKPGHNHA
ncbi:MAG: dihydrolipoyl dehydrogenase [Candidatus Bathyarchaeota archaeon]|nr:dihydrolipoyl dehydrogenase [Candidatus Bathyarchaeota archaeon]